jgi:hypothetical protein
MFHHPNPFCSRCVKTAVVVIIVDVVSLFFKVMESYTIGRENFGMEKEFIMEVVNNCPNPACRYYKTQLDMSHNKPTYLPEPPCKY